jgi:hypothetical protein
MIRSQVSAPQPEPLGAVATVAEVESDRDHWDFYDEIMADTFARLISICNDMPTLMQPECPYGETFDVAQAYRALSLALVILDECCTGTWATSRLQGFPKPDNKLLSVRKTS